MATLPSDPLVWIDCEMTGLNPDTEEILEIHVIITDGQLRPVPGAEDGWGVVVHQPAERLAQMDAWCTQHHGDSGLTAACIASTVTHEQAAAGLLAYIQTYCPTPRTALLAGNSVHADRAFLRKAPYDRVTDHLHYRILDVSSIKEAARRWAPPGQGSRGYDKKTAPKKTGKHRAREDILESIAEAQHYKDAFFH